MPLRVATRLPAGSERVARSEVKGEQLREAQAINKSLSALGDVVAALQAKAAHVPYRNSKLTQVALAWVGGWLAGLAVGSGGQVSRCLWAWPGLGGGGPAGAGICGCWYLRVLVSAAP